MRGKKWNNNVHLFIQQMWPMSQSFRGWATSCLRPETWIKCVPTTVPGFFQVTGYNVTALWHLPSFIQTKNDTHERVTFQQQEEGSVRQSKAMFVCFECLDPLQEVFAWRGHSFGKFTLVLSNTSRCNSRRWLQKMTK